MKKYKWAKVLLIFGGFASAALIFFVQRWEKMPLAPELGTLVINEVCTKNLSVIRDGDKKYPDSYIELYNAGEEDIDLAGYSISDIPDASEKKIELDEVIEAGSYCVLFVDDGKGEKGQGLPLYEAGKTLYLWNQYGELVDQIYVPEMEVNYSFGRAEDGGSIYAVQTSTPYGSNSWGDHGEAQELEAPVLSVESGFYQAPFFLSILSEEDCTIYYTLDGSRPDRQSMVYTEPIYIGDASENETVLSCRTDISMYEGDGLRKETDKATIIKAVAYDKNGNRGKCVTGSYFVNGEGNQIGKKYGIYDEATGVVSIIVNPFDLYDYEEGIMVLGARYDEWSENQEDKVDANFLQRGRKWERQAYIEYFEKGKKAFSKDLGIRIKGTTSCYGMQKGFNLYPRKIYDGKSRFGYDVFGNAREVDSISLKSCDRFPKEALVLKLLEGRDLLCYQWKPVHVFLNGEYWGLYNMTERYTQKYFRDYYGVKEEDVIIFKNRYVSEGTDEEETEFKELFEYAENHDMTIPSNYEYISNKIDFETFINYYCAHIFFDSPDSEEWYNMMAWKVRTVDTGNKYADGKWRWAVYDINNCLLEYDRNNITEEIRPSKDGYFEHKMLKALIQNEEFAEKFVERYIEMVNWDFHESRVEQAVLEYADSVDDAMLCQSMRYSQCDVDEETEHILNFFHNRKYYTIKYMLEYFKAKNFDDCVEMLEREL